VTEKSQSVTCCYFTVGGTTFLFINHRCIHSRNTYLYEYGGYRWKTLRQWKRIPQVFVTKAPFFSKKKP